jgi:hypothetical protein
MLYSSLTGAASEEQVICLPAPEPPNWFGKWSHGAFRVHLSSVGQGSVFDGVPLRACLQQFDLFACHADSKLRHVVTILPLGTSLSDQIYGSILLMRF